MNNELSMVEKLKLARSIGNMQLQHLNEFDEAQQSVLKWNMKKLNSFLSALQCSNNTAKIFVQELHPAFQYYTNAFSVLYKISKKSINDQSAECYYYPYKEHQINIDQSFFDRDVYRNKEVNPTIQQQIDDIIWTGMGTHGLCFIQNEREILRYLAYGTQLTVNILDPAIFPLYKTLVRTQTLTGKQFQVSQAYISENILLNDYRVIKQIIHHTDNLDAFFFHSEYEWTVETFLSNMSRYPKSYGIVEFMEAIKKLYLESNRIKERFFARLEKEFPGEGFNFLFHDREMIERERRYLHITETLDETLERILPK